MRLQAYPDPPITPYLYSGHHSMGMGSFASCLCVSACQARQWNDRRQSDTWLTDSESWLHCWAAAMHGGLAGCLLPMPQRPQLSSVQHWVPTAHTVRRDTQHGQAIDMTQKVMGN